MLNWLDAAFSENMNYVAPFERQPSWSHLQNATLVHTV